MTLRLDDIDSISLCSGWRNESLRQTRSETSLRTVSAGNLIDVSNSFTHLDPAEEDEPDEIQELRLDFVTVELTDEREVDSSVPGAPAPRRRTVQDDKSTATAAASPLVAKSANPWESIERRRHHRMKRQSKWTKRPRKIVVVGDMSCGKTAMVSAYCKDQFPELYMPTIMRCESSEASLQGVTVKLIVSDTPGRHDYAGLRKCVYHKADIVIICCALDCPKSLQDVREFWAPELRRLAKNVPYMLVGTRSDAREERVMAAAGCSCTAQGNPANCVCCDDVVTVQQGQQMCEEIGALNYMECSARYRDGTRRVFEQATLLALRKHRRRKKLTSSDPSDPCIIL